MKKIYTIAASVLSLATVATAQNSRVASTSVSVANVTSNNSTARLAAAGDTLFFYNIENSPVFSPMAINPGFGLISATLNKAATQGLSTPGFKVYYNVRAVGDTNKFYLATSYYQAPAAANNYLGFGALTIPSNGATFKWKHTYTDKNFRDGYVVYASTVKPDSANNYATSTRVLLTTIADNDPATVADTSSNLKTWFQKSVAVPSTFNGQATYLFVHHNANDMNLLALDEFFVIENAVVGIKNLTATNSNLYPNPATNNVTLTNVTVGEVINVYNVLGSIVLTDKVSANNHTINIAELTSGNYIVRVGNDTPIRLTVAK